MSNRNRLPSERLHPVVVLLLGGTALVQLFLSMCYPFLPLFLNNRTDMSPQSIGLAISLGSLAAVVGGYLGGWLSDRFGRRSVMLGSLMVSMLFYLGYAQFQAPWLLVALLILYGLFGSFFSPASRALMSDLTPPERRVRVFSLRYMMNNTGYFLGPLLGLWFGLTGNATPFFIMAGIYGAYLLLLAWLLRHYGITAPPKTAADTPGSASSFRESLQVLGRDRTLLAFLLGSLLCTVVHGLWSVQMSQYLPTRFADGADLFSVLLAVNAGVVILVQPLIGRFLEKRPPFRTIVFGTLLFGLGEVGFAFADSWALFIAAMAVFTVGEVMIIPAEFQIIDNITPDDRRGAYYGAQSFTGLGNFISPWLSSTLLVYYGGTTLFLSMAGIALASILFFKWGRDRQQRQQKKTIGHPDGLSS